MNVNLASLYELGNLIFGQGAIQAIPIRVKILFDRLLTQIDTDEVLKLLNSFGWSLQDYARGYILMVGISRLNIFENNNNNDNNFRF